MDSKGEEERFRNRREVGVTQGKRPLIPGGGVWKKCKTQQEKYRGLKKRLKEEVYSPG